MAGAEGDDLVAQIEALVTRHASATATLEDQHLDRCIDEAQQEAQRRTLSPFLPTSASDLATLFTSLNLGPRHLLVDLGCGDGRPLVAAALLRGCRGTGVDISAACVALAQRIAEAEGVSKETVEFCQLDLLEEDTARARLTEAVARQAGAGPIDSIVLFLYVYPTLLARLAGLVNQLVEKCRKLAQVTVVTLTYHFDPPLVAGWASSNSALCEGRFRMHTWLQKE